MELGDGRLCLRAVFGGCKWELGVWRWELEGWSSELGVEGDCESEGGVQLEAF